MAHEGGTHKMNQESGTYALLLRAGEAQRIQVGALGEMAVQPGWYVYVGSAFGPGGVRARVQRHARGDGARHWHVDYLRAVTSLSAVWYTHDDTRRECDWAQWVCSRCAADVPLSGFGASDCECAAHLVAIEERPSFERWTTAMQARHADHAPIQQVDGSILDA